MRKQKPKYGFWVRSRAEIESGNPVFESHIVISINTPDDPAADVVRNSFTRGVLALHFDDLDQDHGEAARAYMGRDIQLFTKEQAEEIAEFVSFHGAGDDGVKAIVVHCDMGICRSSAVGAALSKWLNGTDEGFFGYGRYPYKYSQQCLTPNMLVFRTLLNVLYGKMSEE